MSKKKWAVGGIAGALLTWTLYAAAGHKQNDEVSVGANWGSGSLGSARASSDSNQYIGCQSYGTYGWCHAADAFNNTKACFWSSAQHAAAVHSIGPQSYLYFSVDSGGNCEYIYVSNYSFFLPATP